MADKLCKLKKSRSVTKAAITSLVKKIEEIWSSDDPNLEELEENLAQLEEKRTNLKIDDDAIIELIDDLSEIEKDVTASSEYYDKITLWKFRINKKLKNSERKVTPPVTHVENNVPILEKTNTFKLPTLKIEKFYGDINMYYEFWNSFKTAIHDNELLSNIDKMIYLKSFLGGDAYNAISGLTLSEKNYEAAIELLQEQFGRKDLLITNHINTLLALKPVSNVNDLTNLRKLYDTIQISIRNLKCLDVQSNSLDTLLVPIILKALPPDLSLEFNRECMKNNSSYSSIDQLLIFIRMELQAREKQEQIHAPSHSQFRKSETRRPGTDKFSKTFFVSAEKENSNSCWYCAMNDHCTGECKNVSVSDKKGKIKSEKKCFICLEDHLAKNCKSKGCTFCKRRHHTSICYHLFGNNDGKINKNENLIGNEENNSNLVARVSSNDLFSVEHSEKRKILSKSLPSLEIECDNNILNSIIDSGTEIPIIKRSCVPHYYQNAYGSVILESAFGHKLKAPLVKVPLNISGNETNSKIIPKVFITCAMVDTLINDLLLSVNAYKELNGFNTDEINENSATVMSVNSSIDTRDKKKENDKISLSIQDKRSEIIINENVKLDASCSTFNSFLSSPLNTDLDFDIFDSNEESNYFENIFEESESELKCEALATLENEDHNENLKHTELINTAETPKTEDSEIKRNLPPSLITFINPDAVDELEDISRKIEISTSKSDEKSEFEYSNMKDGGKKKKKNVEKKNLNKDEDFKEETNALTNSEDVVHEDYGNGVNEDNFMKQIVIISNEFTKNLDFSENFSYSSNVVKFDTYHDYPYHNRPPEPASLCKNTLIDVNKHRILEASVIGIEGIYFIEGKNKVPKPAPVHFDDNFDVPGTAETSGNIYMRDFNRLYPVHNTPGKQFVLSQFVNIGLTPPLVSEKLTSIKGYVNFTIEIQLLCYFPPSGKIRYTMKIHCKIKANNDILCGMQKF